MEHWKNKSLEDLSEIRNEVLCIEKWVDVRGFETYYKVSNFGRIKSLIGRWGYRERIKSQILTGQGYCFLFLYKNKIPTPFLVHRLVAAHFYDKPEEYNLVNHKDSIRTHNWTDNLEWTNHRGNAIHAMDSGFQNSMIGDKNVMAKLCSEDVLNIRKLYFEDKIVQGEIAKRYNIRSSAVSLIVTRNRWKHI